jgi:hypothetical protein
LQLNEDISAQADSVNTTFKVDFLPIVSGNNGGTTTTDPTKVTVKVGNTAVDATAVTVSAVDGADGIITLASAPAAGKTVLATYYNNAYQDTFDILPSHNVDEITRVGLSPSTTDFYTGTDYVLDSSGFNTINWGNSAKIVRGTNTTGFDFFGQISSASLYDNRVYRRRATGLVDGTNPTFTLAYTPTTNTGEGKITDNPGLLAAYVGTAASDATLATIVEMSGASKTITLATAPDASKFVYVTQYQNILPDDVWTLTNTLTGGMGVGTYSLVGTDSGIAMDVTWSANDSTVDASVNSLGKMGIQYPIGIGAGNRDTQVLPGYAVSELVTLLFADSTTYSVQSSNPVGTGTAGDNTGTLNQTYIDAKTAFRVTLVTPTDGTYAAGNRIGYNVSPSFVTSGSVPTRAIPGVRLLTEETTGSNVGDTAIVNTYNKSGNEPNIGDFYYVTFNDNKSFDADGLLDAVFVTTEKNALAYTGPLNVNNKLALAAHLAFLNGAPGVILMQVQKTTGGTDAPASEYISAIDSFTTPMQGGLRPALMEPVVGLGSTLGNSVLTYTKTSNIIQSSIRYANERMTYFGFANGQTPTQAMALAQALNSERMTGLYPDGAVVTLTDELGNDQEFLVDGSLLAAALCGRDTSPAYDVAEPLTRKPVVGFSRLSRRLDTVTQSQVANAGVTILEDQAAGILVKIDLTTDVASVLTRTPSVIRIKDYVQQGIRNALMPYIGLKFLTARTSEITTTVKSYLSALLKAQIITGFTGVSAIPDPVDPTTVQVTATYSPVLPLLWIVVTFNLRTRL